MTDIQETVIANIKTITSTDESFIEMVILRLESLGYELKETDSWSIAFAIQKGENHYKNSCNIVEIPEALYQNLCDVVCGEFLKQSFSLGQIDDETVNKIVTSIKMGDTQVNYTTGTLSFDTLIDYLIHGKEGDLVCYRKLKW